MSGPPAGWYPDDQGLQRYWDGTRWTEHVQPPAPPSVPTVAAALPPGWQPDPDVPGQERFWDGQGWTDLVRAQTLFDGMVPVSNVMKKKEGHLVVTTEAVVWNDETIRWDELTFFTQRIAVGGGTTTFGLGLTRGDAETLIQFQAGSFVAKTAQAAHDAIVAQARRTLGVRIINGLLDMVDNGEPVRTGGLLLAPEGFGKEGKRELVPWREFGGLEIGSNNGLFVHLFRQQGTKRKRVLTERIDIVRSWALPPVVDASYQRYGAA